MSGIIFGTIVNSYTKKIVPPFDSTEIDLFNGQALKFSSSDIIASDSGKIRAHVSKWIPRSDKRGDGFYIIHRVSDCYIVNKSNKL